jgi:hypothetical protein
VIQNVRRFRSLVSAANRRGVDLKYKAFFDANGGSGGRAHYHVAAHTSRDLEPTKAVLKRCWEEAIGRPSPVHADVIQDAEAWARYITQDLRDVREGREPAQVLHRNGVLAVCGNWFYAAGGEKALLSRIWWGEPSPV